MIDGTLSLLERRAALAGVAASALLATPGVFIHDWPPFLRFAFVCGSL